MNKNSMRLNITLIFCLALVCSKDRCLGQLPGMDSLKVSEYHVNSCIGGLFSAIAESDKQYYNPLESFYSVTFRESKNVLYMTVSPNRWMKAPYLDYAGILRLGKASFLLRGDLNKGGIFERDSISILAVMLRKEESDTSQLFFNEPSLQGVYHLCKPLPIDLEVYTKKPVKGFEMKVNKM